MIKKGTLGVLVKPTHRCNLNCSYCYDAIHRDNSKTDMTLDTIRQISELAKNAYTDINWIWHGGEALLMGKEWIFEAQELIKSILPKVRFSIQTNGLLLDKDMRKFLIENGIGIGISYDWNTQSLNRSSDLQADTIFNNINEYIKDQGEVGTISVIDYDSSKNLIENYEKAKSIGLKNVAFNVIFKKDNNMTETTMYNDISEYANNFKKFLRYWAYDGINPIKERTVFDIFQAVMGTKDGSCQHANCVGKWIGINPDGATYQCDRFFPTKYSFGNIYDFKYSLNEAFLSEGFELLKSEHFIAREKCFDCELYSICGGGCLGSRINISGNVKELDEDWCYIKKELFWEAFEIIKDLTDEDMTKLNPLLRTYLVRNGYRSLTFIKNFLIEKEMHFNV